MSGYRDAMLKSFADVRGGGAHLRQGAIPATTSAELGQGGADDVAHDRLHLGHDRPPKGVLLSHAT